MWVNTKDYVNTVFVCYDEKAVEMKMYLFCSFLCKQILDHAIFCQKFKITPFVVKKITLHFFFWQI